MSEQSRREANSPTGFQLPTPRRKFLSDIVIDYGPVDVLGRLFLKCDTELVEKGVELSFATLEEIGIEQVEAHDRALAEQLYSGLQRKPGIEIVSSDDPAHRSAVTVFTTGSKQKDAALVEQVHAIA